MKQRRLPELRGIVLILLAAGLVVIGTWVLPQPPGPRPTATPEMRRTRIPTPIVVTRVPAPIPMPTLSPLQVTRDGQAAPSAPEALSGISRVVNVLCVGDCILGGGPSWVTSDTEVGWTHGDPLSVDYYEVWRSRMEPYFDPATCERCALEGTTTGLNFVVPDSPPGFNPVGGSANADIQTNLDFFRVRAVNAGGVSTLSNEIGVLNISLLQGFGSEVLAFPTVAP